MNSILFVCDFRLALSTSDKIMKMLDKNVGEEFTLEIKNIENGNQVFCDSVKFVDETHQNGRKYRKIYLAASNVNVLKRIARSKKKEPTNIHHVSAIVNKHESKLIIDVYSPAVNKYAHLKNLLHYDGKQLDRTTRINEKWYNRNLELPEWVQI